LEVTMLEVRQPVLHLEAVRSANTISCGYNWLVEPQKPDFVGRDALWTQHKAASKLTIGFEARDVEFELRGGSVWADDEEIGEVVVVRYSPGRHGLLGLARVNREWAASGLPLRVVGDAGSHEINTISSPYVIPKSWGGP